MTTRILVTGATGKQGGALINTLLSSPSAPSLKLFAVTRNSSSPASKALAARKVTLIEGDIATASPAIFSQISPPPDAAFLVTTPGMSKPFSTPPPSEEEQARPFIAAAASAGVKHFVFSSVDRGANADTDPTYVPHFASKFRIEALLKSTCEASTGAGNMKFTILRPVAFMDNLTPDFIGRTFASMWGGLGSTKLQLIAVKDIGKFAAKAILEPEKFQGKAVGLAGDELTLVEAQKVFKEALGGELPVGYWIFGALLQRLVAEVGTMLKWFKEVGYAADVDWCRAQGASSLGEWLKTDSGFKEKKGL